MSGRARRLLRLGNGSDLVMIVTVAWKICLRCTCLKMDTFHMYDVNISTICVYVTWTTRLPSKTTQFRTTSTNKCQRPFGDFVAVFVATKVCFYKTCWESFQRFVSTKSGILTHNQDIFLTMVFHTLTQPERKHRSVTTNKLPVDTERRSCCIFVVLQKRTVPTSIL